MIEAIKNLFLHKKEDVKIDNLGQGQREAIIDLLLLAAYSDSRESQKEIITLENTAERFDWQSDTPIESYIETSRSQAQRLSESDESRLDFLKDIGERLENREGRYRALRLCNVLLYSDAELIGSEVAFIQEVAKTFELK